MFNQDDDDLGGTFVQRLLLAAIPVALAVLIPSGVEIWKELRAAKEDERLERKEDERFENAAVNERKVKKRKKRK